MHNSWSGSRCSSLPLFERGNNSEEVGCEAAAEGSLQPGRLSGEQNQVGAAEPSIARNGRMRHSFDHSKMDIHGAFPATNADDWIGEETILSDIQPATGGESSLKV